MFCSVGIIPQSQGKGKEKAQGSMRVGMTKAGAFHNVREMTSDLRFSPHRDHTWAVARQFSTHHFVPFFTLNSPMRLFRIGLDFLIVPGYTVFSSNIYNGLEPEK